jgi:hypothetical protein
MISAVYIELPSKKVDSTDIFWSAVAIRTIAAVKSLSLVLVESSLNSIATSVRFSYQSHNLSTALHLRKFNFNFGSAFFRF